MLQAQAQTPGGQQRVQGAFVEVANQCPLRKPPCRKGKDEGRHDGDREIHLNQIRCVLLCERGSQEDRVSPNGHELTMRHVDDAHLPKDHGQSQAHQQQHGKETEAGEALHQSDVEHVRKRHVHVGHLLIGKSLRRPTSLVRPTQEADGATSTTCALTLSNPVHTTGLLISLGEGVGFDQAR